MADCHSNSARSCAHCGKEFLGRTDKKYCSHMCGYITRDARRQRNKTGKRRRQSTEIVGGKRKCLDCGRTQSLDAFPLLREAHRSTCRGCINKKARQRTPEQRRKERERAARACGKVLGKTPIRFLPYDEQKRVEARKSARLSQGNAKQAWDYWLKVKAPNDWVEAYWETIGTPWMNPRLSDSEKYKIRYQRDLAFQLQERMRRQVNKAKNRNGIAEIIRGAIHRRGRSPKVERELGYTIKELMDHLERQFTKGMSWEKFKAGDIHIDHITPQAAFDLSDDEQWKTCWSLPNLRPLWAKQNIHKSSRIVFLV